MEALNRKINEHPINPYFADLKSLEFFRIGIP